MERMREQPKSCPFCGEKVKLELDGAGHPFNDTLSTGWVVCLSCDASGPAEKSGDGIEAWNKAKR